MVGEPRGEVQSERDTDTLPRASQSTNLSSQVLSDPAVVVTGDVLTSSGDLEDTDTRPWN